MPHADINLFDKVPDTLFGPLASPNRRLYWQVLLRLFRVLFDEEMEAGSDYGHGRGQVVETIEMVLSERSDLWVSEGPDEAPSVGETPLRVRTNAIYYMLRDAGWLDEERRGYHDYVTMPPRVNQCLAMLIELSEGRALIVSGKLKSLEAGMRQVKSAPEAQADTLAELAKDAGRFARHLNSIRGAIKGLYDQIRDTRPRDIVSTFFDDFLRDIFIRDYAAIKTSENPLRIRDELLRIVTDLRYRPELKGALKSGYVRLYGSQSSHEAHTHLEQDLSRLEQVFSNIEMQLDAIDAMKVRYERRVDSVIDYATRTPRTLGKDLRRLASALVRHAAGNDDVTVAVPMAGWESLGENRIARPKRPRTAPTPRVLKPKVMAFEVKERAERERAARRAVRVDDEALQEFLSVQVGSRGTARIADLEVRTLRDYFCVLTLRRVARMEHAEREFPDALREFELRSDPSWIETEFFRMQDVVVTRRRSSLR